MNYNEIQERAANLPDPIKTGGSRLVVHIQTSPRMIDDFLDLLKTMATEKGVTVPVAPPNTNGNGIDYRDVYVRVSQAKKA